VLAIVVEKPERVAVERRNAFLLKLADALRPLADPVIIQDSAARVVGEHLGAARVPTTRRRATARRAWSPITMSRAGSPEVSIINRARYKCSACATRSLAPAAARPCSARAAADKAGM
jgi:hypothetical protein